MTTHKVEELTGLLLDAAVAKAEGRTYTLDRPLRVGRSTGYPTNIDPDDGFAPSTSWNVGGPIIERERIAVMHGTFRGSVVGRITYKDEWHAHADDDRAHAYGPTPLVAAMRAYVASKFSDEVEL